MDTTKEKINKLEDRIIESIQIKAHIGKRGQKNLQSLSYMWNNNNQSNTCIPENSKGKQRELEQKKFFKKIMTSHVI